ncbi:MAG: cytochrome c peroxidase [Pseudomonadota bacterium]
MKATNVFYILIGIVITSVLYVEYKRNNVWNDAEQDYKKVDQLGLPDMQHPKDNLPTKEKVALGRKLFMDRRFSHNNTISCAMCHVPEQGFTVNEIATAVGIEGRTSRRNAPTILNVGYYKTLFHDGREFSLENQVVGPILAFNEMGNPSIGYVIEKIHNLPDYNGMFEKVFGAPANLERFSQAIAAYERTLVSGNSRFDQWYYGKNQNALNESEINGFKIFMGKGRCVSCHSVTDKSALFTDQSFHNTGIGWARNNRIVNNTHESKTLPVALAPGIVVQVAQDHFDNASEVPENDVGRFEVTDNPKDSWAYKTPSIRNVALTAPYMHDGSLRTLEEVVEFYNKGGEDNPFKDPLLQPLNLSEADVSSLVAFMKALTGSNAKQLEEDARADYTAKAVH